MVWPQALHQPQSWTFIATVLVLRVPIPQANIHFQRDLHEHSRVHHSWSMELGTTSKCVPTVTGKSSKMAALVHSIVKNKQRSFFTVAMGSNVEIYDALHYTAHYILHIAPYSTFVTLVLTELWLILFLVILYSKHHQQTHWTMSEIKELSTHTHTPPSSFIPTQSHGILAYSRNIYTQHMAHTHRLAH